MHIKRQSYVLIKVGTIIDGNGGKPILNGAILIKDGLILAVGNAEDIVSPDGASVEIYDYPDKVAIPGMIDCHTHHNGFGDGTPMDDIAEYNDEILTLQSAKNARASLYTGVTTIRENGPKNLTMFRIRDAIQQGIMLGPRMVLCGRPMSIIGGHMGYFGSESTGPDEARGMVRQLIKEGADYIKITATGGGTRTSFPYLPSFDLDELCAITEETRKFGKLSAAHCMATSGIVNALDADVDMIIHCYFKNGDGSDDFNPSVADRMGEQGVYINPTVHVARARAWKLQRMGELRFLSREEKKRLDVDLRTFEERLELCRRLIDMGHKMITGSDSSWDDYKLGNTINEVECLAMAGFSPMKAIMSVTSEAAKALDVDRIVGTLEPSKEADVILIDGDPLKNINDLRKVFDVFFKGKLLDRGSEISLNSVRQWRPNR